MQKRLLTAIPALILLVAAVYFHGLFLTAALWVLAIMSEYEVLKAAKKGGVQPFEVLIYAAAVLSAPVYLLWDMSGMILLLTAFVIAVCIAGIARRQPSFKSIVYTLALCIYPQLFYVFLYAITKMQNALISRLVIVLVFAVAILTDTFAYFIGSAWGKRKLCPAISPHKTVEGAIGGVAGGMLAAAVVGLLQGLFGVNMLFVHYIITGFGLSVLSQFGDLMASLVKREFGVKDYSNVLPGHGGIMDRLDSALFIAPVAFIYFTQLLF